MKYSVENEQEFSPACHLNYLTNGELCICHTCEWIRHCAHTLSCGVNCAILESRAWLIAKWLVYTKTLKLFLKFFSFCTFLMYVHVTMIASSGKFRSMGFLVVFFSFFRLPCRRRRRRRRRRVSWERRQLEPTCAVVVIRSLLHRMLQVLLAWCSIK